MNKTVSFDAGIGKYDAFTFRDFRQKLEELEQRVPEESRDTAIVEFDISEEWSCFYLRTSVTYSIPLTEEEKKLKEKAAAEAREAILNGKRRQLARLKKELGEE